MNDHRRQQTAVTGRSSIAESRKSGCFAAMPGAGAAETCVIGLMIAELVTVGSKIELPALTLNQLAQLRDAFFDLFFRHGDE